MTNYISDLDTSRFGFKIAKINDFSVHPSIIMNDLKEQGVKLVISRINGNQIDLINSLEKVGFIIKDIQLKYKYDIRSVNITNKHLPKNFSIRESTIADLSDLVSIAKESFNAYGHYFADPKLDCIKCIEIYMDWTKRSCLDNKVADKVFLAEKGKNLIGFLAFKIHEKERKKYAAGVLGAVSKKSRGSGVFTSLVQKGLLWAVELNLDWEEHNVLVSNLPVNFSMTKSGFNIVDSFVTMHCWLD